MNAPSDTLAVCLVSIGKEKEFMSEGFANTYISAKAADIKLNVAVSGIAAETGQEDITKLTTKMAVDNLNFYYGSFHALRNLNMDIPTKRITAIIGPSGSGKSTFLRLINRMSDLTPGARSSGSITLDGQNIFDPTINVVKLREKVGMVFQKPNPFPKTIYDNIAYGPRMHGVRSKQKLDEIVESCLRRAAIWNEVKDDYKKKSALALSGGQQQRICIARTIAVEPEVILMDEPCSALDPISTLKIEELMVDLRKNFTIVTVTHNMQQAARASDYTAVFMMSTDRAGEVVEFGQTHQIFTNPKDEKTALYVEGRLG
jgi:phosphate transport system ATP-binding protein